MRRTLCFAFAWVGVLVSSPAWAQSTGFAVDRFEPAERGSDWFVNESLDLRGSLRPAFGVVGDYAYKPLVLYDANGDEHAAVIRHQLFVHVGGALVLFDRLRLGANLPLLAYSKGESVAIANSSFSSSDKTTIGDLRLSADLRLLGSYGAPFTLAFGVQAFAPTGNQDAFASDGKVRVRPRLMFAGDVGPIAYAGQLGFNYRARQDNVAGDPFGSEATFSAAAGVRAGDLLIGPEIYGSTVVSDSGDGFFKKRTTPLEVLLSAKYRVTPDWRIGAGVGPGLTRGIGAPEVRVVASIEWFSDVEKPKPPPREAEPVIETKPAPSDRDHDGVLDADDACPDVPGVASPDKTKNGCPAPKDSDGDGIVDEKDACPTVPGVESPDPTKNGCPPPKDTDGDGIIDAEDACPAKPGPSDPDPKKNGCPRVELGTKEIKINEQIQFDTASDKILPASDGILQDVLKVIQDHPEITKLSVEGHTDNRGGKAFNKNLSKRRAASVVKWFTTHGVDPKRLTSAGFGQDKPIATNDTEEGRQQNRRVEFQIKEKSKP